MIAWETGPEHMKRVNAAQYALVDHLREPSRLAEAKHAKANGGIPSLSAFFMINLIESVL